jgi:peptidoglycan hydrolase-like protein with peptidoglycan-binding domain
MPKKTSSAQIVVPMAIDVDGAPNAYGPNNAEALDLELNAHVGAKKDGAIVGYLTKNDDGRTPVVQGPSDPFPGFFVSTTGYADKNNTRIIDPRRYVNAAEINYTLHARAAKNAGVKMGDVCVVHSLRTRQTVFAIVGDSGNSSGAEGSLALLQRLGYNVKNGKSGGEDDKNIVVRYFAGTNPDGLFFFTQAELEAAAQKLDLDTDFSSFHPGEPGHLVFDAVSHSSALPQAPRVLPFAPLGKDETPPPYPGHLIKIDTDDKDSAELIQQRLRDLGYTQVGRDGSPEPLDVDGIFGTDTVNAVELFQTRHTDLHGSPLDPDGQVGSDTWGALFGRDTVHMSPPQSGNKLLAKVLEVALGEVGVTEEPPGSNRGKRVEEYMATVGVDPGDPWCAAFVFFCFATAAKAQEVANPMVTKKCKTGSVLDLWNRAQDNDVAIVTHDAALDDPSKIKPGMIFIISTGGGHGHTGLVANVVGNRLVTIEGNTNDGGSREGVGVFRREGRTIDSINRGFIDMKA